MQTRHLDLVSNIGKSCVLMFTLSICLTFLSCSPLLSLPLSEISSFAVNLSTGSSVEEQSGSISITVGISKQGQGSNLVL